jgi:hypothetical protein
LNLRYNTTLFGEGEMRQVSLIAASIGLVLFVGGCSGGEGGDAVSQETPADSEQANSEQSAPAASASPSPSAQPAAAQPANRPNRPRGILPADLINSTNPDQRLRSIQSARPDPFSLVPTSPAVTITREVRASGGGQSSASAGSGGSGNGGSGNGGSGNGGSGGSRRSVETQAMLPQSIPALPDIPRLPRPMPNALAPQPELARAVSVSGVVQIGSIVYAIVDAPDEPSSRYVQVGQRLSNGEIIVRRIDMNGSDSSVILEQAGMQVVRRVGDAPVVPEAPATPGAPREAAA